MPAENAIPRCATCKHWTEGGIGFTFNTPPGFGECSRFDSGYVGVPNDYPNAYIDPRDPYIGQSFFTSPVFGCLAHEAKDAE